MLLVNFLFLTTSSGGGGWQTEVVDARNRRL